MPQLTNIQIDEACKDVLARSAHYQYTQYIAFQAQYQTGCREGEVIELWRWSVNGLGRFELITEKGNGHREFIAEDLPLEFRQWIAHSSVARAPTSTQRMRSAFNQMSAYRPISVGDKGISTHLFRYNYIRRLHDNGATIPEIKVIMGLVNTKVVNGYINNIVIGDPPS